MSDKEVFPNRTIDLLVEAARWAARSRSLLYGGVDGRVIEDTRKSLEIIEKYVARAIVDLESKDGNGG